MALSFGNLLETTRSNFYKEYDNGGYLFSLGSKAGDKKISTDEIQKKSNMHPVEAFVNKLENIQVSPYTDPKFSVALERAHLTIYEVASNDYNDKQTINIGIVKNHFNQFIHHNMPLEENIANQLHEKLEKIIDLYSHIFPITGTQLGSLTEMLRKDLEEDGYPTENSIIQVIGEQDAEVEVPIYMFSLADLKILAAKFQVKLASFN